MPKTPTYANIFSTKQTPQTLPIPGETQIENHAGGYVYEISDWDRLDRFLILGSPSNTYYQTQPKLSRENAECVLRCIKEDGPRTVRRIAEISIAGRAPKQGPALFALAMCSAFGDDATKNVVATNFSGIARIPTHLFEFLEYAQDMRGWGRHLKHLVDRWYALKDPAQLAYHVVKYQNREGWTHRDVLRKTHIKALAGSDHALIYNWIVKGWNETERDDTQWNDATKIIVGSEKIKTATGAVDAARLITDYNLPRECVPTQFLKDPAVWEALLPTMPMTALIRNLATMNRIGFLTRKSDAEKMILARLESKDALRKARVHPIALLVANLTYGAGRSIRGDGTWEPVPKITEALDDAFYTSFQFVAPTGKRHLLALDVSGSMTGGEVAGIPGLSPLLAEAALALVILNTEKDVKVMAFSQGFIPLEMTKDMTLAKAMRVCQGLPHMGTDCAIPMLYAGQNKLDVDAFITITDSETWYGQIHPKQALAAYRKMRVGDAKNVVIAVTATDISIADPNDPGSMDAVGFDAAMPAVIADFIRGNRETEDPNAEEAEAI
jgi:60 kDa SS-A/Ro ribonucleoprotein